MSAFFRFPLLALWLVLCTTPGAYAKPYFNAATIPPTMLSPPFAEGSPEQKAEIEAMIKLQQQPDPAEIAKAAEERHVRPESVAQAVEPTLSRADYPALYALLDRAGETNSGASNTAKNYWNIKRPFLADSRVKPLIQPHYNLAYPSGHTSSAYVWAYVLAMVLPEKRAAFLARAEEIAQHRVLVGVHFPNDLTGGRQLALLVMGALTQNADFQKDLLAAKQELAARRKND